MTVLRIGFFKLSLERETVGDRDGLARREAAEDFDVIVVLAAGPDLPRFKAGGVAHEQRGLSLDGLQRRPGNQQFRGLVSERHLGRYESARFPAMVGVRHGRDDAGVAGFTVEQGAHEDHLRTGLVAGADGAHRDRAAFAHRGDVLGRYRKIDPDVVEIDDDEQLALLAFAPDQSAEIDPALRDTARDRRAQELLVQGFLRLVWQVGDFILR
jgi:hypothetical protein